MKYQIEEFWLDDFPTGGDLVRLIEDNYLKGYSLFELVTEPKPRMTGTIYYGDGYAGNWHIVRFRKKDEE